MIREMTTFLGGELAGYLLMGDNGICDFQYTDSFCRKGIEPSPLLMPAIAGRVYSFPGLGEETFQGLPGMVADSLPDSFGQALLEQWLEADGKGANTFEKLSYMGKRCMGALEYEPSRPLERNESSKIEIETLIETARKALSDKEMFKTMLKDKEKAILDILKIGTSAGGQRAKAVIAINEKTGEIRSGQVDAPEGFSHWIMKFDGFDSDGKPVTPSHHCRVEYAYHLCAIDAGIEMTDCKLMEESGRAHFLTRRFDRDGNKKIHVQTLCGLAHYDNRHKGAYSYEQAMAVARRLSTGYGDTARLFRRMVFNVLAVNMDDHTKNISFLMDRNGKWSLSPAYDIAFSHNPKGLWADTHQMTVNGKRDNITRNDLLEVEARQGVKGADEIIKQVEDALGGFQEKAKEAGVPDEVTRVLMDITREKTLEVRKTLSPLIKPEITTSTDTPSRLHISRK